MKNKKIIYSILLIIVIIGIIIGATLRFNFDIEYAETKRFNIYTEKQVDIEKIKDMVDEIYGKVNKVEYVETFKDMVAVTVPNLNDEAKEKEQKTELINKINSEYQTEINADEIEMSVMPHFRGRDFIKRYIMPIIVVAIIIIVYFAIRYHKLGSIKVALSTIGNMTLIEAVYISLIAITRVEINRYTVPLGMLIAVITLLALTNNYEIKLKNKSLEEKKK